MISALLIVLALITGLWAGWQLRGCVIGVPTIPNPPAPPEPRVTVVVPQDYKPLEPLMVDGKPTLVGPRALLFYAAYQAAVKALSNNGTYTIDTDEETCAFETARQAVRLVYGETFDA